jgi:hypothetical protein
MVATYTPPRIATGVPMPSPTEADAALRRAAAFKIDPVRFAIAGGFAPDPWQVRFLRSGKKRRMLNCSRQVGKSTVVSWGALHRAVFYPGSLVLLLSAGERQSKELMRKVYEAMQTAPNLPELITEGKEQAELANGSRIIALPGTEGTVRGYSAVDLLVVDEASRVADALHAAIKPMLAVSKGEHWTLSTPYGTRGWWYEEKLRIDAAKEEAKEPTWDYYEIPATKCPRITPEFLAQEYEELGEWWYRQEYFCEFLDAESAAFRKSDIDAAFDEDVIPWLMQHKEDYSMVDSLIFEDEGMGGMAA